MIAGASQRGREQVPGSRRPVLDALLEAGALDLRVLPEGWRSGALIRIEQASAGDVLLSLGGGAGVEHLANLYAQSGRSIIPLDFDIGASRGDDIVGGAGLAARALRSPDNFLRLPSEVPAAGRLAGLSTRGDKNAEDLAERIVQLGGEPDLNPASLTARSHSEYVEGTSLVDMIRENLVAERIAIESYREIVQYLDGKDPTSHRMMRDILAVEEEHAEDLNSLLQGLKAS